jgi:pyridoxine 4-dehydrogenase
MPHDSMATAHAGTYRLGVRDVARMGYGAMQLRRCTDNRAEALTLLRLAVDLGVNHVDTAQFYGNGFVNDVVGAMLREESGIVVATKVGADPAPGGPVPLKIAQRPEQLRASVEDNLRSLGVDQLSVVNLRRMDVRPGFAAEGDQIVDIDDQLAAMVAMRDEGKIGAIGLSAIDMATLKRAIPAGIVCVQNAYNVASREFEDMLDLCVDNGIAWVPFFPLGGSQLLAYPNVADQRKVVEIAARMAIKPSQLGLAWLLAHKSNVLLIPGTASITHLEENMASAGIRLSAEVVAELDAIYDLAVASSSQHASVEAGR